jgi:eukaryotic-like serine/threonine-protein kinase
MASQREWVKELFGAALELEPAKRAAFLDRACNDPEVKREVEALLAAHAGAGTFLEHPTEDIRNTLGRAPEIIIGPYHLLELIGEGGMGEVWLAEQKQPVRRRVAIKLIKAGMDTREVVTRFESERQALALMDHPAIAKVFDAGSTPEGRPYFVMEYVPGIPISDYCDRHKLTIRQRMELFIQVCEGVQHAHQKAIIHRDLKPSNILVTEIDGKPMPRIIDFGVAKATSQKLTAETVYTRLGMLLGTLGYMSPEQADPVREDIDTRADVYSLGAVLYELLTGTLPLDFKKLAYDEVIRCLRDQDAPRPSTKITTLGGDFTIAAKNRGSDPPALVSQLRGDPDAITLKALEKDRARRYASASELATDIGHYLRHEPVTAHPPSISYRTSKYLRRHRLGLAVAAVAVLAVALLVTWWHIPPAIPTVESVVQLTDDGQPKSWIASDTSRIYFNEERGGNWRIAYVPVTGGSTAPVETKFAVSYILGLTHDSSSLLVMVPTTIVAHTYEGPIWAVPLPAGEPRRLGNFVTENADVFPDGRIIFGQHAQEVTPKGSDTRSDWFITDKDGFNLRKLASFPASPGREGGVVVSPDGKQALLTQELVGDRRLFEIGADGAGLREVRRLSADENGFVWTPDERYLIYQSGNARQSDIWLLPMQTGLFRHPGKPVRLTNGPLPYSVPLPSRDGKQIFVLGTKQRGEFVRYDTKSKEFKQFLSGVSATNLTFSADGKWVAYASYPDHVLWRSRSDGTERMQLTYAPMDVRYPSISSDGTRVAFNSSDGEVFVVSANGGMPQKIAENGYVATWSPDGNYLFYQRWNPRGAGGWIIDVRTGKQTAVPSSRERWAFWLTQDTLVALDESATNFVTFNLNTQEWTQLIPGRLGDIERWMISPDAKYLYFTTRGADPKAMRFRVVDHQIETITSLKDIHRALNLGASQINVAPDGSPIFTRDTGYQEIYALNIHWP